jgi:hypothetical protein
MTAAAAASQQLAALAAAARDADGQLTLLAAQFRSYQEQKAREVGALEARLAAAMSRRGAGPAADEDSDTEGRPHRGGWGNKGWGHSKGWSLGAGGSAAGGGGRKKGVVLGRPRGARGASRGEAHLDALPSRLGDADLGSSLPTAEPSQATSIGLDAGYPYSHQPHLQHQHSNNPHFAGAAAALSQLPSRAAGVTAEVAVVVEQERLSAALRDVQWERLLRQRAEASADAQRCVAARLKAKLRARKEEVGELKSAAAAGAMAALEVRKAREEAARLTGELAAAKDLLRTARNNGARRQRAAAATAAALLGGSLSGSEAAALATAAAAGGGGPDGEGEGVASVEGLSLAVAALSGEVAKERSAKEALEGRLREARAGLERKNTLIR